jgi:hypothetical protein
VTTAIQYGHIPKVRSQVFGVWQTHPVQIRVGCIPILQKYLAIRNRGYTNKACLRRLNESAQADLVCIAPDF